MKKTTVRKLFNRLPPNITKLPMTAMYYLQDGKKVTALYRQLDAALRQKQSLTEEEKAFYATLRGYCLYMNRAGADKYLNSYLNQADFRCVKRVTLEHCAAKDVILICCVRNDLLRIQQVYQHHRSIGIQHMAFVDNMSDDGTFEWLMEQDVDVYQTSERYHAGAKSAWVRKVQEQYGFDRWYLVVDSDELFSYVGMEEHPIAELVQKLEENHITRMRAFLLDMYASKPLFQSENTESDFVEEYRYFDSNSYYNENDFRGIMLRGGPRKRVFEAGTDYAQPLTKYPLLFVSNEDVWADHTPMPFEKNFHSPCLGVLRHYKFLPSDQKKFVEIANSGNYAHGSYEYKNYIEKTRNNQTLSFYNGASVEFTSSQALKKIPFMKWYFEEGAEK